MAEYEHIVNLRENLFNANSVVYLAVLIWWIACLWIDEPGNPETVEVRRTGGSRRSPREASAKPIALRPKTRRNKPSLSGWLTTKPRNR